jgi:tRNA pseudouridine38-40 synthase
MARYLIQLAYKGTNYNGWQKQQNALGVQQVLEEKISMLMSGNIEILGCGRTDTGVHALQYLAHFDCTGIDNPEQFLYKLNQVLPADIAVYNVQQTHADFNARFDATLRTYEYVITRIPDPFMNDLAWYYYGNLDVDAMNKAASMLLGTHDFECFSKVHTQVNNYMCTISEAYWKANGQKLVFTISANRFLRNMVRAIVGTLMEVGRHKMQPEEIQRILQSKNRCQAGQSVPAQGLYLTRIQYPHQIFSNP